MGQLERAPRLRTHFPRFSWDAPLSLDQQRAEHKRMIRSTAARQDLQTLNTCEGTRDVHALILERAITGIQAFF